MNIPAGGLRSSSVEATALAMERDPRREETAAPPAFDALYDAWFHEVCRWLRAMGAADGELEDLAQEVFLVVQRKLPRFDGGNLAGWLYRIARNEASDHRRSAWFRHLFARGRGDLPERAGGDDPADLLERAQERAFVHRIFRAMAPPRRTALWLFAIEGYSGEEIAALEGVPPATVRTRLLKAREEFRRIRVRLEAKERR